MRGVRGERGERSEVTLTTKRMLPCLSRHAQRRPLELLHRSSAPLSSVEVSQICQSIARAWWGSGICNFCRFAGVVLLSTPSLPCWFCTVGHATKSQYQEEDQPFHR